MDTKATYFGVILNKYNLCCSAYVSLQSFNFDTDSDELENDCFYALIALNWLMKTDSNYSFESINRS